MAAIYHTVNPRLFPDQIAWIVDHAQDRVMMTDLTFVPLLEKLADRLPSIERYIVLTDSANMPKTSLKNAVPYEAWIGEVDGDFAWKNFDENTAAGMCYTSGTTGHPKGVVYSHRSNVLHSMIATSGDAMGISSRDVVMPVVPMFHANCWGIALTAPMNGATSHHARTEDGRRLDLSIARRISRHVHGRGADHLADAVAASGNDRRQAAAPQTCDHRRLSLPARDHREIREGITVSKSFMPGA